MRHLVTAVVTSLVLAACSPGTGGPSTVTTRSTTSTSTTAPTATTTATVPPTTATTLPQPAEPVTLATVELVDAVHGWGLTPEGRVLRTADGGRTWTAVTPEPVSDRYAIADFHQDRGWVLYRPADLLVVSEGGAQTEWVMLDLPVDFEPNAIAFADADHGFVLADGPGGAGTIPVALLRTADGGHTWETVAAPPADDATAALESGHSTGLGVTAGGRVWVGKGIGPRPEPWLAVSADGGRTWTERVVPVDADGFCGTDLPRPDGALFGTVVVTCDGDRAWFAMTGDDGETWDVAPLPGPVVGVTLYEDGAIAWGRKLYETIEPPGNWETLWTFGSAPPSSLSMPDAVHGLAVVNGQLWWTGDGGDHWERLAPVLR